MIPDEFVEQLKEQADIVGLIGEHVKLRRVGTSWRGPCPFHGGKNPNFSVNANTGFYHCFKCHEAGTIFTFLQKRLGMSFVDAVEHVAGKMGVVVPKQERTNRAPDPPEWEVNAAAAEFFRRTLWESEGAAPARAYLEKREVDREAADRFGIGFAPQEIGLLRGALAPLGFDDARMLAAGLLVKNDDMTEPRPRFRRRLVFPILDVGGNVVGFGGRALGTEEPKYLNSSESAVFTKRRLLYGLHWAKAHLRRDDRALLVEGYFDVLRLMTAGVGSVVAPLGTALTTEQVALLTRYTRNVYLLFDSDEAGRKATSRSGLELLTAGAAVRVVSLPDGEDPDTFVQAGGAKGLEEMLEQALDFFDWQVRLLERRGWFADLHRKRNAIDKLLPTIRATADAITRDLYVGRLAEAAGVDRASIVREVEAAPAQGRGRPSRPADQADDGGSPGEPPSYDGPPPGEGQRERGFGRDGDFRPKSRFPQKPKWKPRKPENEWQTDERPVKLPLTDGVRAERDLVQLMLKVRGEHELIAEDFGPDEFRGAPYRAIFEALLKRGADATLEELAQELDEPAVREMQALLAEVELDPAALGDPEKRRELGLNRLRVRRLEDQNREIDRRMSETTDEALKTELMLRKKRITEDIRALGGIGARRYGIPKSR